MSSGDELLDPCNRTNVSEAGRGFSGMIKFTSDCTADGSICRRMASLGYLKSTEGQRAVGGGASP